MRAKVSGVLKEIAKKHSAELGTKGSLLFKAPIGAILSGIYLDRAPSGNTYVECVILPLHKPTNRIYYSNGLQAGFDGCSRLRTATGTKLWETAEDYLVGLEEVVINELLPEWNRLSNPIHCIEHLTDSKEYQYKWGAHIYQSLIYLTAYQQHYERCMQFICEYRQLFPDPNPMRLSADSYPGAYWQRMELIEECIRLENFSQLDQKLSEWYQYSVQALGLTKFV